MTRVKPVIIIFVMILGTRAESSNSQCVAENIPQVDPDLCCNMEEVMDKAIAAQCKLKYEDSIRMAKQRDAPSGCCFSECVLNVTGFLKNGEIDVPFAIGHMKRKIPDPNMDQILDKGMESCIAEIKSKKKVFDAVANLPPLPNGERNCNPLSGHFLGCMYSYIFRNCPDTRWVAKTDCQKLKDHFKACPLPFPVLHD